MRKVYGMGVVAAVLALAGSPAWASLLAYEGFDYTAGSAVSGLNGGSGWQSAWSASVGGGTNGSQTVTNPTLSEDGITGIGNRMVLAATGANVSSNANRTIFSSTKDSGTYWLSVMASNDGGNSTSFGYVQLNDSNSNVPVRIGYSGGASAGTWYVASPVTSSSAKSDTGISATAALLVLKLDLTNKEANLWVNPTSAASPADATLALSTTSSYVRFDRMSIRVSSSSSNTTTGSFDEIRLGQSYADVVPEPASLVLIGLAGVMLLPRRRQQQA